MNIDEVMRLQRAYAAARNRYETAKNIRDADPTQLIILWHQSDEAHRTYQAAWDQLQAQLQQSK